MYEYDEHYCPNCEDYTEHECSYSQHERDSSMDFFVCLECRWEYDGFSGKYKPPTNWEE